MSIVDVSRTVSNFSDTPVTRIRRDGAYVGGIWVENTPVSTSHWGCVRPVDGRTRDAMPEGVRTLARWVIHADWDIRTDVAGTGEMCDQIVYNGVTYDAISIDDSFQTHGQYTRVALTELQN